MAFGLRLERRETVFGVLVNTRRRRRGLVVGCYGLMLAVLIGTFLLPHSWVGTSYSYVFWFMLGVNYFVLGGMTKPGAPGLVKAFANKPPRDASVQSELIRINLESATGVRFASGADEEFWRNDEREIARRDAAHYQAYQWTTVPLVVLTLLGLWSVHPMRFLTQAVLSRLIFGVALGGMMLAMTLPQAILLWTEPELGE